MSASAALGTVPDEAPGKSLLALSGPLPWPHNPLLRHRLSPVELEPENSRQSPSNSSANFRRILCGDIVCNRVPDHAPLGRREDHMSKLTSLTELADETDDELLARYREHDDGDALAVIHSRHEKSLRDYAQRELGAGSSHDAEEIVQQAFLEFHEHRKAYPPQTCVRALLFTIVGNRCADFLRRIEAMKRDRRLNHRLLPSHADPKTDPSRQQSQIEVNEMLDTFLTPEQAQAVRLTRIEGHTAESAAELVDVPATAMRKRVERGIKALKELAAPVLILLAIVGSVADGCDLDVYMELCTVETDVDEVFRREDSGHDESNKLCRKSLMRLPIWPEAAEVDPNMTCVVNARYEDYDVLIARPSKSGNPFQIGRDGDRERVIRMYEVHIRRRPDLLAALPELAGKRLGCYCKPEACHGDVLVKLLRELFLEAQLTQPLVGCYCIEGKGHVETRAPNSEPNEDRNTLLGRTL